MSGYRPYLVFFQAGSDENAEIYTFFNFRLGERNGDNSFFQRFHIKIQLAALQNLSICLQSPLGIIIVSIQEMIAVPYFNNLILSTNQCELQRLSGLLHLPHFRLRPSVRPYRAISSGAYSIGVEVSILGLRLEIQIKHGIFSSRFRISSNNQIVYLRIDRKSVV